MNGKPLNWPSALVAGMVWLVGSGLCRVGLHNWHKWYRGQWRCQRCLKRPS